MEVSLSIRKLLLTIVLLAPCAAWAQNGAPIFTASGKSANDFWANNYGSCTWGTTAGNDAGPCVNLAIAAAAAAGGGTVRIPAGSFNVATAVVQGNSGVWLVGAGVGNARDNFTNFVFRSVTRLVWTGAADATMFTEQPSGSETIYSGNVAGIVFDCASLAGICAKFSNVSYSTAIEIGVSEPRSIGAWFTTTSGFTDGPGTQENNISVQSRSTNAAYSPTGMLFDGNSAFNVSYNRMQDLFAWYYKGDGIVFGSQDNNQIYSIRTFPQPGATGTPVVVASPGYVMPNGIAVTSEPNYVTGSVIFTHTGSPVTVQGYTAASTLVAGVGNTGTAVVTPLAVATTGTGSRFTNTLSYASTTGIVPGMDFSCGNPSSGSVNHNAVSTVVGLNVTSSYYNIGTVAAATTCTFNWGVLSQVRGTYTITATGATTYNIAAPGGGHSQSGISVASGVLAFTDVVIPISGSAVSGDTFVLTVHTAPGGIYFYGVDNGNGNPEVYFAPGATGLTQDFGNPIPKVVNANAAGMLFSFGQSQCGGVSPNSTGFNSITMGNCGGAGASGTDAVSMGGTTNQSTNFGSATIGGQNNGSGGIDSFIGGGSNNGLTGNYSRAGGFSATDRGRYAVDCFGNSAFTTRGDRQWCFGALNASGTSAAGLRLTADALTAAAANVWNIPAGASYSGDLRLACRDFTTGLTTINDVAALWRNVLLSRGNAAGTTAASISSATTPDDVRTNGTGSSVTFSVTADTTNAGLNVTVTVPASDTWRCVARIADIELGTQ